MKRVFNNVKNACIFVLAMLVTIIWAGIMFGIILLRK
jgi:hypothetical protein